MKKYTDKGLKRFDQLNALVWKEHIRQIDKWGIQTHSLFEWLAYTTEELGELAKAISEFEYRDGKMEEVVKEAISVATLCLKIAEMVKSETNTW